MSEYLSKAKMLDILKREYRFDDDDGLIRRIESGSLDAPSEWNACIDAVLEIVSEMYRDQPDYYTEEFRYVRADVAEKIESLRRGESEASSMNADLSLGRFTIAECAVQILNCRDEDNNDYKILRVFEENGEVPIEINLKSLSDLEKDKLENQIQSFF